MTTTTTEPPARDLLDDEHLRALAHGLGGAAEVDALLTLFVALLRQRLEDLADAVSHADTERVDQSCRTLGEPAAMLGLDRLQGLLRSLAATEPDDGDRRRALAREVTACADETAGEILRRLAEGPRKAERPDQIELMLRRLCAPGRRRGAAPRP